MRIPSSDGPAIRHKSLRFTRTIRESYIEQGPREDEPEPFITPTGLAYANGGTEMWLYPIEYALRGEMSEDDYWVKALADWLAATAWAIFDPPDGTADAARSNIQRRKDTRESARPRSPQRP